MQKTFLEAGEVVTTHGVAGEVRVYPWSDGPEFLQGFDVFYLDEDGKKSMTVQKSRPHKRMCLIKFDGVDTMEAARALVGRMLWISREDVSLAPGRFFVQDLLGAKVVNADTGIEYGDVIHISQPGRHDVYVIKTPEGDEVLFPAVDEFVQEIDVANGVVKIRPIEGMFPVEDVGGDE